MIEIRELTIQDLGREVIYHPYGEKEKEGMITDWNNDVIFIRYGSDVHSKGTYPWNLDFVNKQKKEAHDA